MRIERALYEQLIEHAREEAPNECCGLISMREDRVIDVYRARNIDNSELRFTIHPDDQFRINREIEEAGLDVGAIYHSHTRTKPKPSQTDLNFAELWPGVIWVIVGLADGEPEVQAWSITDGQVSEESLQVE